MNQRLQQNQSQQAGQVQSQAAGQRRTFEGAEEAIRADREQTAPPDSLGKRLAESISAEPAPPPKPWWKRLFG